jgi:hypothetical protein
MKPLTHAKNSARKFGGKWEDYIEIHEWMDQTKAHLPDMRHRMVLHNSWGIYMGQDKFGYAIKNSDGKDISVRAVLEHHVIEDLGHIPTLERCFSSMVQEPWMGHHTIRGVKMKVSKSEHNIEIID